MSTINILQILVIQILAVGAMIFFLRKIMYKASVEETNRLQKLSEENAKKSQELAQKLEEAKKQYEQKIAKAEDEARKIKTQAQEEIEKLKDELLNKAKQESEKIVNQALNTKDKLKEEIEAQLQEKSITQSLGLIQEVLSSNNINILHEGFIKDILDEVDKLESSKLKATTDKGTLSTPYAIDRLQMQKMISLLSKKTGKKINLEEKIDKKVMAGIVIKLGSLVIDASLSGRLKEAAEKLKKG